MKELRKPHTLFATLAVPIIFLLLLLVQQRDPVVLTNGAEKQNPVSNTTQFSEHLIADKYAYAYGIAAADLDRDGDLDLTSADYQPHNKLYLFENDSQGNFKRHHLFHFFFNKSAHFFFFPRGAFKNQFGMNLNNHS